jgi:hypothetical protein
MKTAMMAAAGLLMGAAHSMAIAQTAEMPTANDFAAGETWEFRQVDALTKLEGARTVVTVVKTDTGMAFSSDGGNQAS